MSGANNPSRGANVCTGPQALQSVPQVAQALQGAFLPRDALALLFNRSRLSLSPAELLAIAEGAATVASELTGGAADLAAAMGCLIDTDSRSAADIRAGNFQSGQDVPGLLSHFAAQLRQIEGMATLASYAAGELAERGEA
jgi:hypothetical protein